MHKDTWPYGGGSGNPLQYSCLGDTMDRGTWQATVHEVAGVGHDLATKPPQPPYDCISLELGKGFPSDSVGKESVVSAGDTGDTGSIPGSERSSGGGHGSPLQYFCLENPMDRGAWQDTVRRPAKSQTRLSQWACFHTQASLVARWKRTRLPTQEVQAPFLGREDALAEGTAVHSTPASLPGESHGQRSLAGYSPWGHKTQTRRRRAQGFDWHTTKCIFSSDSLIHFHF